MKKHCMLFLLFLFPYFLFSQGVGILSVGTTLESSKKVSYDKPMLTFELDALGIAPNNGFTFFWNNAFSWAKKDLQLISSEILLGATFRKDKALNISFGFGAEDCNIHEPCRQIRRFIRHYLTRTWWHLWSFLLF